MPVLGTQKMAGFRRLDIPIFGVLTFFDFPHFSQKLGCPSGIEIRRCSEMPVGPKGPLSGQKSTIGPSAALGSAHAMSLALIFAILSFPR
jgi:hypothetical protein